MSGTKVTVEFLMEQDGAVERKFKTAISDAFWKSGLAIHRAYLLLVEMRVETQNELRVMLAIIADHASGDKIVALARSVFRQSFAADEQLLVAVIDDDSETKIRRVASPFYEVTVSS